MKTLYKNFRLSKHKCIEFQIEFSWICYSMANEWFRFEIGTKSRQDHGGFYFYLCLLRKFAIMIDLYDTRHWDLENNCWKKY